MVVSVKTVLGERAVCLRYSIDRKSIVRTRVITRDRTMGRNVRLKLAGGSGTFRTSTVPGGGKVMAGISRGWAGVGEAGVYNRVSAIGASVRNRGNSVDGIAILCHSCRPDFGEHKQCSASCIRWCCGGSVSES